MPEPWAWPPTPTEAAAMAAIVLAGVTALARVDRKRMANSAVRESLHSGGRRSSPADRRKRLVASGYHATHMALR